MMDTEVEEQNSMNHCVKCFAVGSEANDNIVPTP